MAKAAPNTPRLSQPPVFASPKVFTLEQPARCPTSSLIQRTFVKFKDFLRGWHFCRPQIQTGQPVDSVLILLSIEDKRKFRGGRKPPSGSTDRRVMSGKEWPHEGISYPKSLLRQPGNCRWVFGSVHAVLAVVFVVGVLPFSPSSFLPSLPNRSASPHRRCALTSLLRARTGLELCLSHSTSRSIRRRSAAEIGTHRFLFPFSNIKSI